MALAIAGAWLLAPISAYADTDLEALVAEAFHARVQDAGLHEIAHQRAVEIADNFSHEGRRPGTAEVLAYNGLGAARAVQQWLGSPDHFAILSDPQWGRIGCGSHVVDSVYYGVCVLTWGGEPEPPPPDQSPPAEAGEVPIASGSSSPATDGGRGTQFTTPEPVPLPNTAMGDGSP